MPSTMASGFKVETSDKEKVVKFGQTVPCMKDGGVITKQMEKEDSFTPMVTSMMVNGKTTRLTAMVSTAT